MKRRRHCADLSAAAPRVGTGSAGRGVGVRVDCLGGMAAADLLGAWAAGLRSLDLVSDEFTQCPLEAAVRCPTSAIEAAASLLTAAGAEAPLEVNRLVSAQDAEDETDAGTKRAPARSRGPVLTRRQLFPFLRNRSAQVASTVLTKDQASVGALHATAPPSADLQLLKYLDALPTGRREAVVPVELLHLAAIEVSAACDGCSLCTRYCPHGALTVTRNRVKTETRLCTACGLWVEVCPPEAITLVPAVVPLA